MTLPANLESVIAQACTAARDVPGFLTPVEARMIALMAACTPGQGAIVEIGSFKGKSTVALATVAAHYALGPVVSIDPHTAPSETCPDLQGESTSFHQFLQSLERAALQKQVEVHRAFSQEVAKTWTRPIRLLWIDGDHTYPGAKSDFDLFAPFVIPGGVIALHDALHEFEGPIRVFVEQMLRSDSFGAAGFCGSIAWAQHNPQHGAQYRTQREALVRKAQPVIPLVRNGEPRGIAKLRFKLARARVPRKGLSPQQWLAQIET